MRTRKPLPTFESFSYDEYVEYKKTLRELWEKSNLGESTSFSELHKKIKGIFDEVNKKYPNIKDDKDADKDMKRYSHMISGFEYLSTRLEDALTDYVNQVIAQQADWIGTKDFTTDLDVKSFVKDIAKNTKISVWNNAADLNDMNISFSVDKGVIKKHFGKDKVEFGEVKVKFPDKLFRPFHSAKADGSLTIVMWKATKS